MPPPPLITATQALQGDYDAALVRIEARLLDLPLQGNDCIFNLRSSNTVFAAHLPKTEAGKKLLAVPVDSFVRVTGVCSVQVDENRQPRAFRIHLRSAEDMVVLQRPPRWTLRHALWAVRVMGAIILAALAWVGVLRRRVQSQTETIRAALESTADGILVVNAQGKIVTSNRKFAEMWGIPERLLATRDDNRLLEFVQSRLKEPAAFLARVREACAHPDS